MTTQNSTATSKKSGLSAIVGDEFDAFTVIGGWRGILEATVPTIVFLVLFTIRQEHVVSALIALAVAAVGIVVRLAQGLKIGPAISGVVTMGISVFIAWRTGQPENVFLMSILKNGGYGLLLLASIAVRWPLIGVMLGALRGEKTAWRKGEQWSLTRRRYYQITWIWFFVLLLRFSVLGVLYFAGNTQLLGLAKLMLGVPADAVAAYFSWLLLRTLKNAEPATTNAKPATES